MLREGLNLPMRASVVPGWGGMMMVCQVAALCCRGTAVRVR
jgi:hypothetical protein